jgi:hypothetical protein
VAEDVQVGPEQDGGNTDDRCQQRLRLVESSMLMTPAIEGQSPTDYSLQKDSQRRQYAHGQPIDAVRGEIEAKQHSESNCYDPGFGIH